MATGMLVAACGAGSGAVTTIAAATTMTAATSTTVRSELAPGSTTAGSTDPALVDRIEDQQAIWEASGIDDYTAVISVYDGNQQSSEDSCGANTSIRVVVEDGAPVEAIDLARFCELDPGDVTLIDDLFDLAMANAGALEEPINFDEEHGFVRYFFAGEGSVEVGVSVEMFQPRPIPAVVGNGPTVTETAAALDRWEQAGIEDYSFDLDVICFCTIGGRFHVVVEDGVPVSVTQQGDSIDPGQYDFIEFTVEGLFELGATWGGGRGPDQIVASFHPDLGYPIDLRVDAITEAVDDEVTVVVHDFTQGE
jgi:hypothetical protein